MRSTTRGSVMKEIIFISAPQLNRRGVHLENPLDKAGPRCPAPLNKIRGRFARCGRVRCRRGLLFAEGFRRLCAIGKRPIVAHAMAAAIRNVGRDGVEPVKRGSKRRWVEPVWGAGRVVISIDPS